MENTGSGTGTEQTGKGLNGTLELLADVAFIAGALAVMIVAGIRYLPGSGASQIGAISQEAAELLPVFYTALLAGLLVKENGHIRMTVITHILPRTVQRMIEVLVCVIGIGACGYLTYFMGFSVYQNYVRHTISIVTGLPWWVVYAVTTVGFAALTWAFFSRLRGVITGKIVVTH